MDLSLYPNLKLYNNNNIQSPTGSTFPSAISGDDLDIVGTYTTDTSGVVLSSTDSVLRTTGNTTFQTISLWFRFHDILPFNLFDSANGESNASFTAVTVPTQARSVTAGAPRTNTSGISNQKARHDDIRGLFLRGQGASINESTLGPEVGIHYGTNKSVSYANVLDFDYRNSVNQYGVIDVNGDVTTSIDGTRVSISSIWAGTAKCIRYDDENDKFIIMIEGTSDQVCMLDGDSGVVTSVYSNTGLTIAPRSLTLDSRNTNILYFIDADLQIYSLDISLNTNVPVQIGTFTVSNTATLEYYNEKLYAFITNSLHEIHVANGQEYYMGNGGGPYMEFENGFVSWNATNGNRKYRRSYDFSGRDGRSYTLTEGTNTISATYIDGQLVSSLEDMIDYSYGGLHNVVVVLSNPSTSVLTLFGNSSGLNSPNVTVESLFVNSTALTSTEVLFSYSTYINNPSTPVPIPRLVAKDITDFSVDIGAIIEINDLVDYQALTSDVYTGTFNSVNIFSLNTDLDFSGETKSVINNFRGVFNGNGFRLSNHDDTYIFNNLTTGAAINNVIFHNYRAIWNVGITSSISGSASVTNCVCCGTFFTRGAAFCDHMSSASGFSDNLVMVSNGSRFLATYGGAVVCRGSPAPRCFFAGTSDVLVYGSRTAGTISAGGNAASETACNFNGYVKGLNETGGVHGTVSTTPDPAIGMYACGSFDLHNYDVSDYIGRIVGNRTGGTVQECYYYGSGNITHITGRALQAGYSLGQATTIFSERKPSRYGGEYLETDEVIGGGLKSMDTSVWAGGSFAGPDIFKNVPHVVPVESFETIYDPIGTIQLHLTNKSDYPVFMKFKFDDPDVSFIVLDNEYREVTGYKAKIVSRHHTLTNSAESVTNPSGLEYFVNVTTTEFDALVEPVTVIGTAAKTITDFSVRIGDITVGDYDDLSAMFRGNYSGVFHPGNRFIQTADIQYPDSTTVVSNPYINNFEGVYNGNGFRFIDVYVTGSNMFRLSQRATVINIFVNNIDMTSTWGIFGGHTTGAIVKHCKVAGDIITTVGPALTQNSSIYGVFEDCQILASGDSYQPSYGSAFVNAIGVNRIFVATQPGHMMNSTQNTGGVMQIGNTLVTKIGCNMRSFMYSNRDRIGLISTNSSAITGQTASRGFYGCGNATMIVGDSSMSCDGITGEGGFQEFFSANSGNISMQSTGNTNAVPTGRGTVFADFSGEIFDQGTTTISVEADVDGNQGGMYSLSPEIWTAPWDVASHLDYPSILVDLPHFIPLPDDEIVNDIACTIQMYASMTEGYSAFFKIHGDRYKINFDIDLIGRDGLPMTVDGTWVVQFTFPFDVEATKNIVFRETTLTSLDSRTYVIGGIPFVPFVYTPTYIEAKNVTDFSAHTSDIITMNDLADFQAVIGVSDFHPSNVFNMTADVNFQTITDSNIFTNFDGTFDGKGYRIKNRSGYTFSQKNSSTQLCTIKNVIFQNTLGLAPIEHMYGRGKVVNCVSCGVFDDVSCGLVRNLSNFSSIENCYVLAHGKSLLDAGMSSDATNTVMGVSKSFFCGTSKVSIDHGGNDSGCIGRSISLGGNLGVNFKGSVTSTADVGGLVGESRLIHGMGYYVCGDFDLTNGNGLVERVTQSGTYLDETYYANRGDVIGGVDITQGLTGPNNSVMSTAFAEYSGTFNGAEITSDVSNPRNSSAGVYSKAPGIWWSPWSFVTTRPSFLKETPHFVPIEDSGMYSDVLGEITIELEDITRYPVFVQVDYLNDTDMSIKFFDKYYYEITTSIAVEIVFPLAVDKNIYNNGAVVSPVDGNNLTYKFGVDLGTLIPGFGNNGVYASSITDFSAIRDYSAILFSTIQDVQAMYQTNYTGAFSKFDDYYIMNDIDLHQETFDTNNDRIVSFTGRMFGQGFKLLNHQGYLFNNPSTGASIRDITFIDFHACAISGSNWDGENLVFVSGSLEGTQTKPMLGDQPIGGNTVVKNMKAFLYGTATINTSALMGATDGASELFLATTSGIHSNATPGVVLGAGQPGFNIGCNVNGTSYHTGTSGIIMAARGSYFKNLTPDGGGYYATGKHAMVRNYASRSLSHTFSSSYNHAENRADQGGVYTAVTGGITTGSDPTIATDTYLGPGAGYATGFSQFLQGITEDVSGVLGNMYDVNIDLWVAPWVLAEHLDHPSILRAMPHYIAIENRRTIASILGDIRVFALHYPIFLEIKYVDNGDSTDSFVYTVFDTTYTPITEGVRISVTYPFQIKNETSMIFDGEEIDSDDKLNYLAGDSIWFDKSSPLSFVINWAPVEDAESYQVTIEYGTSGEVLVETDITKNRTLVQNLDPETLYTIRLYFKETGGSYSLAYTTAALTINPDLAENYENLRDEVLNDEGEINDLSALSTSKFNYMEDIVQDIFPDKAVLKMKTTIGGVEKELTSTLVHRGSTIDPTSVETILTSFNPTETNQYIELATDDAGSTQRLDYDPASNTFTYENETLNVGDSIEVNGKRITVIDT